VRIAGDAETLAVLLTLLPQALHPMPPVADMHYTITRADDGRLHVREEGDLLTVAESVVDASDAVYIRAHRRAFELAARRGWSRVHAATVDLHGRRVVIAGPSGAGKTTLALRLLVDGAAVQGDESVLVHRSGTSLAVPRAFHVKEGTAAFVPELRELLESGELRAVADVTILDPSRVRPPWVLHEAPIDHVVLLERASATDAKGTAVDEIPTPVVLEALIAHTFPLVERKADLVRTLLGAAGRAQGHRVVTHDPGSTVSVLHDILS
jgi:hypothetical protein